MTRPILPHPMTAADDVLLLAKLTEELGVASTTVGRCLLYGLDSCALTPPTSNRVWLEDHLADVMATLSVVVDRFGLNSERMSMRGQIRAEWLHEWATTHAGPDVVTQKIDLTVTGIGGDAD